MKLITKHQSEKNGLATQIAHVAGLRAHELLTLAPINDRAANIRPCTEEKFQGRTGVRYTVIGKGGLIREVVISNKLSNQLESRKLAQPETIRDRGINYVKGYNIGGGNAWSNSFSRSSQKALGWSRGGHGVRHSYGQERMNELQQNGMTRNHALKVVSQEMGHFRPEITEVYLR